MDDQEKREILSEVLGEEEDVQEEDTVEVEEETEVDDATEEVDPQDGEEVADEGEEEVGEEPVLDPQVVERARRYGYTDETLAAFDSTEQLEAVLGSQDKLWLDYLKQLQNQQQEQDPQQQQQPAAQQKAEPDSDLETVLKELDEDDPTRLAIEKLSQRLEESNNQLTQLYQYNQSLLQSQQQQAAQEIRSQFDTAFDSLDSEIYGKGSDLTEAQQSARQEAEQTALALLSYEYASGNQQVNFSEVLRRGAHAAHSAQLVKEKSKTRADKVRSRSRQRTGSGTRQRTSKVKISPEEAVRKDIKPSDNADLMAEIYEKLGLS